MRQVFFVVAVACLVPSIAHAQPSDADRAMARSLAHEGFEAQQRADYALAADKFARADGLVHAPTLLLGLARAQVGLGKLVAAHDTYQRIVHEVLDPHAPAVFGKAVADAKRELAALEPRLSWVTIRVDGASSPEATMDDVTLPDGALGVRRACDPGSHVVHVRAPGFKAAERAFTVVEGGDQTVTLSMNSLPEAPAPAAAAPPPEAPAPLRIKLALASFGLGAAGLITGGVAGVVVLTKHSSLSAACMGGCPPTESGELYSYRTLANVSTAALIVAGVGAATGVTLVLADPNGKTLSAYAGPMSAGVIGKF
jgi:hypothetical protein